MMIDVNIEYSPKGWLFVTPRPLSEAGLQRAKEKARSFYQGIIDDFRQVGLDDSTGRLIEELERAIVDLDEPGKIRNVTDQGMQLIGQDGTLFI